MRILFEACPSCGILIVRQRKGMELRCPCCYERLEDKPGSILEKPEDVPLERILTDLEVIHYEDIEFTIEMMDYVVARSELQSDEVLRMKARLLLTQAWMRQGRMAEAGLSIRKVHAWAVEHSDSSLLARSHKQLSSFFFRMGDISSALEHALHSLGYLPEDTPPLIRCKHVMALAVALDINGDIEDAQRRYDEVLEVCRSSGHIQLTMYNYNNMAFSRYKQGDIEAAAQLGDSLRRLAEQYGIPLAISQMDTVSRIDLALGRPEVAESTLLPLLESFRSGKVVGDIYSLPDCMMTIAEARRLQGDFARAQATLDEARLLCEEHSMKGALVQLKLEQARLYAAVHRYKEAYEEHLRYHEESEILRSAEREARSRILHTVFEIEEARRSTETYRELAHRDPLTGLYNRRFIDAYLDTALSQENSGQEVTAVLIDLDYFKCINDTLSHQTGDAVLVQLAKLLTATAVEPARAARLGGEEFLILCPGYNAGKGLAFAQRLCEMIRLTDWSPITGSLSVTASIGVSTGLAGQTDRMSLLHQADRNLYKAKHAGRNQVAGDTR